MALEYTKIYWRKNASMAKSFDELIGKTGNKKTRKIAAKRTQELLDAEFLRWLVDRLINVYGESPNVDFVHRVRSIADRLENNY